MKATEANSVFESNRRGISFVYNQIEAQAKAGYNHAMIVEPLRDEDFNTLLKEGYEVKVFTNLYGEEVTKIKW